MTIRQTFLVLVAPLFLFLAGINGALLYVLEQGEAARGLEAQAIAAAVTTAAFASGPDDLAATIADPRRDAALLKAAANIEGLVGLHVAMGDGAPMRIAGRGAAAAPQVLPAKPTALPIGTDAAGRHVATAIAPAAGGRYVIAQIDAEPLFDQVAELRQIVLVLLIGGGVVGFGLAWWVARRIAGELARNAGMIAAIRDGDDPAPAEDLSIRETRDLAHAVRLMKTGVDGRLSRGARELAMKDRRRSEAVSVGAFRETAFAPLAAEAAGALVAVRALGEAPAGGFYALATAGGRAGLVVGKCEGSTPSEALARALAARRFFERRLLDGDPAARVEQGRNAFALARVAWTEWEEDTAPDTSLALLDADNGEKAAVYAARAQGVAPAAIVEDLRALLTANGLAAVIKPTSVESGQA